MADCCVCFTKFDRDEHKPRSLPCGHALCNHCVFRTVETLGQGPGVCPTCRATVPDWLALPVNYPVLQLLEQQSSLTSEGSGEQQYGRVDSGRMMHRALSATRRAGGSSIIHRVPQGSDSAHAVAYHVRQLLSREPRQQHQAATALAELTAFTAEDEAQGAADADADAAGDLDPSTAAAADGVSERNQAVRRQVVDAGAVPALVALLQQTLEQGSMPAGPVGPGSSAGTGTNGASGSHSTAAGDQDRRAEELQRLGLQVLVQLLLALPDIFQSAVDAGVLPILQQLLACTLADTQNLAVTALLAASSDPAVQASVLRMELVTPVTALLQSDNFNVQIGSIELLQKLLPEQQQQQQGPGAAPAAALAAGSGKEQKAAEAVAALSALLQLSPSAEVRSAAYTALWTQISTAGPAAVAQQAVALLRGPDAATQLAGFDLLVGLLKHFLPSVPVEVLSSKGVIEAAARLLASYEPDVQAAAAKAAAALADMPEGVAALVSIPQAVRHLVGLMRRGGLREPHQPEATNAVRLIAANSVMSVQPESVRDRCCSELRAAGAIPAALHLLRASVDPSTRNRPSIAVVGSALHMLQWCIMRPDAAAVIQQAGGLPVLQQLQGHEDPSVREAALDMVGAMLGPGVGA